jgi:ribose transport system permease protein
MPPESTELARGRRLGHTIAQNIGLILAGGILALAIFGFILVYGIAQHRMPGNFELTSTIDSATPLVFAAVGQSFVILTKGIDLSVGGVVDLANAMAAVTMGKSLGSALVWSVVILIVGAGCGLINGLLVGLGRLQPIVITLATLSIFQGVAIRVLPQPGGAIPTSYTDLLVNSSRPYALIFIALLALFWFALRRSRTGVDLYAIGNDEAGARRGRERAAHQSSGLHDRRYTCRSRRPLSGRQRDGGRRDHRKFLYALLDRGGRARWGFPVRRTRIGDRRDRRGVHHHVDRRHPVLQSRRSVVSIILRGCISTVRCRGRRRRQRRDQAATVRRFPVDQRRAFYAISAAVSLFAIGGLVHRGFLSLASVESILVIASFVGLVAAGQCFVILIGGIDLSVPWVLNAAAIVLTTTSLGRNAAAPEALTAALGMGIMVGAANGIGVAWLGVPAVVMTLAMNGIMEGLTLGLSGGFTCGSCSSYAPPIIHGLAHADLLGIPDALWLWLVVIVVVSAILGLTRFGRATYALGNNSRAAFLAGVGGGVGRLTVGLYAASGFFAALAGVMLVGFGGQASLGMGDPYLFTSIAAVVIGGVNILGGRGSYLGVAAGAVSLTVLVSVLLALNMPDYVRSIAYGVVILVLLLAYGRDRE